MNGDLLHTIVFAGAFLTLFASAELLYHKLGVKAEVTRKYVHIVTGILTLFFPPLINNHWYVLALCASFLFILIGSLAFKLLPSINAVDRVTRGSLLYPFIVYGCYLGQELVGFGTGLYYIPILILALSDPIAAMVGKNWPMGRYTLFGYTKTVSGSFGFFVGAFAVTFLFYMHVANYDLDMLSAALIISTIIAMVTTVAEAISHKGYDNLTIPATAFGTLWIIQTLVINSFLEVFL